MDDMALADRKAEGTTSPSPTEYQPPSSGPWSDPAPLETPNAKWGLREHHGQGPSEFSYEMMQRAYSSSPASPFLRSSLANKNGSPVHYDRPLITAEQMRDLYNRGFPPSGNTSGQAPTVGARVAQIPPVNWQSVGPQQSYQDGQRMVSYPTGSGPSYGFVDESYDGLHDVKHENTALQIPDNQTTKFTYEAEHVTKSPTAVKVEPSETPFPASSTNPSAWFSSPNTSGSRSGMGSMWHYLRTDNAEPSSSLLGSGIVANPFNDFSPSVHSSAGAPSSPSLRTLGGTNLTQTPLEATLSGNGRYEYLFSNATDPIIYPPTLHSSVQGVSRTYLAANNATSAKEARPSHSTGTLRVFLDDVLAKAGTNPHHGHQFEFERQLESQWMKLYTTHSVQQLKQTLDAPDIDLRAQGFLQILTGAKIPRAHRFWEATRGRKIKDAVGDSREKIAFEIVEFEDGEKMTIVYF